jgi:hypothetical protein
MVRGNTALFHGLICAEWKRPINSSTLALPAAGHSKAWPSHVEDQDDWCYRSVTNSKLFQDPFALVLIDRPDTAEIGLVNKQNRPLMVS